jgi:hypothetical protein
MYSVYLASPANHRKINSILRSAARRLSIPARTPLSSTHIQTPEPGSHLDTRRLGTHDEYLCFKNFRIEGTDELNPIRLFYKVVEDHKFELHSCTLAPQALLQLIAFKAARRHGGRSRGGVEIELSHFHDLSLKGG